MKKLLLLLLLAGCSPEELIEANKKTNEEHFKNPVTVGYLADNTPVKVIEYKACPNCTTHYIYTVGPAITVNTREGKTDVVYVTLNGKQMTVLQAQIELTKQDAEQKAAELKRIRSPHN